jgi:hypothetical protein
MPIFSRHDAVGSFAGFAEGGLEFHSDIVIPYDANLQNLPMHGQFVVVQLAHDNEALLGRITTVRAQGRLASPVGEDFAVRQVMDERPIPEDIRERFLKYRIDIRILGVVSERESALAFVASHRRVPHVGAKVAFLSDNVLRFVVGAQPSERSTELGEQEIGFFALGEFVYSGGDGRMLVESWMNVQNPTLAARFPTNNLVSRRTVVFARAGFGKSNLLKTLIAATYTEPPTHAYVGGDRPVGMLVFDPEGEYFFPDNQGRPGLCDVPHLRDQLVVLTDRQPPSGGYESFVIGGTRVDVRDLPPSVVLNMFYPDDWSSANQERLSRLSQNEWADLFDAYTGTGYTGLHAAITSLHGFTAANQASQASAAVRKIEHIARNLHDPDSRTLQLVHLALSEGKVCVVDISQLHGKAAFNLAGIILNRLFTWNQEHFTLEDSDAFPVIAVIEEAQSVLAGNLGEDNPFVEWTKEGRKYGLGSILVTQQPGALPPELVSQADNFFVFHLLSDGDLKGLKAANAHFSDDLLSSLLNEPIPGNGVVWSSASGRPYPISTRILDFARTYPVKLPDHDADETPYAASLATRTFVSGQQAREALATDIDEAVLGFEAQLKTENGVPIGTLGASLKAIVIQHREDLADNDNEAFRTAMNEGARAVKRLTPSGYKTERITVNNKKHLCWKVEAPAS